MKKCAALAVMALLTSGASATPANPRAAAWYGQYVYEHYVGETAAGTGIFITYSLTLSDSGCQMDNEGYQTNELLLCTAQMEGNSLRIGFRSYPDGTMVTNWGTRVYRPNQRLLTLTRTPRGIITRWGAIAPDGPPPPGRALQRR